ncbi:OmpA family protein [Candidatus Bathyarchaeota archaeon]|nr:OmpA family protein [Candidatus Bathyarchaeota archaeon]
MKRSIKFRSCAMLFAILSIISFAWGKQGQVVLSSSQEGASQATNKDSLRSAQEIKSYLETQIRTRGPQPVVTKGEPLRLKIPFDFNSAGLTPEAKRQLDELGNALKSPELSQVHIELAGHTDERGSTEYNLELSRRRVESAKAYLLRNFKVDATRITAVGYGESKPIIQCATSEAEHAVNRRVEISRRGNGEVPAIEPQSHETEVIEPKGLSLQWGVFHVMGNDKDEIIRYDGTSILRSSDAYRIYLHPKSTCYVYIYQVDSKGKGSWLFPRKDIPESNPVIPRDYWLPSRSNKFTLDNTVGTETIYLVATHEPANDLESSLIGKIATSPEMVTTSIRTRGLGEIRVGPPPTQGAEKSVDISGGASNPSKSGLKTGPAPKETERISMDRIPEIFGRSGDFYVELRFKHE